MRTYAEEFTDRVEHKQFTTDTHDVGFMIFCSFGNGYRLTGNPEYRSVIETASDSLCTRFDEEIGCIRSWDWGHYWNYPVIIDKMMYRFTQDPTYLDRAVKIAEFIVNHPNLPEDGIPYWDFDAPGIPDAPRDASAGAIICSALLELSGYVTPTLSEALMEVAENQIQTLAAPQYLARPGSNQNFILKHSVGNLPDNEEIDVPIVYADYYFVEALLRYQEIRGW